MNTLKEFSSSLVSYIRTPKKIGAKVSYKMWGPYPKLTVSGNDPIGVIVALGPDIIGWSMCKTKPTIKQLEDHTIIMYDGDKFNKKKAFDLAIKRAIIASSLSKDARESMYNKIPYKMVDKFNKMRERSLVYFKRIND